MLPALPAAWPAGRVTGLRARNGFEIDLSWQGGVVDRVQVRSRLGRPLTLRHDDTLRVVEQTTPGETLVFVGSDLRRE